MVTFAKVIELAQYLLLPDEISDQPTLFDGIVNFSIDAIPAEFGQFEVEDDNQPEPLVFEDAAMFYHYAKGCTRFNFTEVCPITSDGESTCVIGDITPSHAYGDTVYLEAVMVAIELLIEGGQKS